MTIITDTDTAGEELSIAEASLEFGLTERIIREAVRTRRLPSIPHRWGTRVRRADVAELANERRPKPRSQSASASLSSPPAMLSATAHRWQPSKVERAQAIVKMVGELGEVSISRIHQRFIESGAVDVPYSTVAQAIYHLVAAGKLVAHKQGGRYSYHLSPDVDVEDSAATPIAAPTPATSATTGSQPHSYQMRETTLDVTEQETLTALHRLARSATLAEIYQAMPSRWAYYEVVRAVRQLVELKLAVRIKQEHRYLYQAAG